MTSDRSWAEGMERAGALDALARHYASRLEHYCLRAPYQWFNFYEFWDTLSPSAT